MNKTLLQSLTVPPEMPAITAVEQMTKAAKKILLVADSDNRLLGIVTDFDVRQAILNSSDLKGPVSRIMNASPVVAPAGKTDHDYFVLMERKRCHYVPVVDDHQKVVTVLFRDDFVHFIEDHPGNQVVIMAGGLGTRLRPMTEQIPKPLLPVGGRPILFILLDQILSENFDHIFVSLHYKSEMIINAIQDSVKYRDRVQFLMEPEPLGTAGALSLLPEVPRAPFAVINADLLTNISLAEMIRYHTAHGNDVTMALKLYTQTIPYGVAEVDNGRVTGLREKPQLTMHVNTGVYVVSPEALERVPPNTFYNMTDVVADMLDRGRPVGNFPIHEYWLDIGTHDQYRLAQSEYESNFR